MNKTQKSIETRDLQPGMVLSFTGAKVLTHPYSGISTGRGKVDFIVETKSGAKIQKSWNRHTIVVINCDEQI